MITNGAGLTLAMTAASCAAMKARREMDNKQTIMELYHAAKLVLDLEPTLSDVLCVDSQSRDIGFMNAKILSANLLFELADKLDQEASK